MPQPTVGRVVYYEPTDLELQSPVIARASDTPFRADVVHPNSDNTVNLLVSDHFGRTYTALSVPFNDSASGNPGEAHWMPYQVAAATTGTPAPSAP
jgi:hypothetical protein